MARRTSTTYGGSSALFPSCDKSVSQKLERVETWIADCQEWLAQDGGNRKARARMAQLTRIEGEIQKAILCGEDWCEMRGQTPYEPTTSTARMLADEFIKKFATA